MASLILAIGKHIEASGQSESAFGEAVVGDKALIKKIRNGCELKPETEIRVWRYLDKHKPRETDACKLHFSRHGHERGRHRYDPNGPSEASKPTEAFKGDICPLAKRINHLAVTAAFEAGFDADPVIGWHLLEGHKPAAIRERLRAIGEGVET